MLPLRFIDRVKFVVERQFVKGAHFQLLVVVAFIGLISLVGGLLVMPTGEPFKGLGEAVWWAFLRLTDPGYLGDDVGTWRRILSTILTISGYVVFLGTLVAIMTRWLIARMSELEQGLTPVAFRNHIVILGWTNRTLPLVRELTSSVGRMRRFLQAHDTQRLRLVVLADKMSADHARQLRADPGIGRRARQIVLRSGTPLQNKDLHRAACLSAAAVIVPSRLHGSDNLVTSDVEAIKALLSLDAEAKRQGRTPPYVVAEIEDVRKQSVMERAYSGPLEVVAGDATISRLITQNLLHPGLSEVYSELLTAHEGNEFYLRPGAPYVGETLAAVAARCPRGIVCGLLRRDGGHWRPLLNPASNLTVTADDRLVIMARTFEETDPGTVGSDTLAIIERHGQPAPAVIDGARTRRVLILGWNHRVPALIHEMASYRDRQFEVDLVSVLPPADRIRDIERYSADSEAVSCRHIEADYMLEGELRRIDPAAYDSVVLLSSDRLASGEEADARAIVAYLVLDEILEAASPRPQLLVELKDEANDALVVRDRSETLISPLILSHVLSQVALRRELRMVFDELFTASGAEILFRPPMDYALSEPVSFQALEAMAAAHGETALGFYRADPDANGNHLHLNPPRDTLLHLAAGDSIVVLTTI